jgi:protein-S-isoprenylcysteine O-methyltransferase Ste14
MNKKFFCKDRILAVILLVISGFFALQANMLPASNLQKDPGPKIFPWIGCGILALCAVYLLINPGADGKKMKLSKDEKKRLLIMIGIYLFLAIGTLLFGVVVAFPIALFIVSYLFSKSSRPDMPKMKRIITTLIYTVCVSGALYLIYVVALDVRLKSGMLF